MPFKLYYTPTSCGGANFIAAHIGGLKFDSETVDLKTHKTASGADFYAVNPKGNVPTVVTSDGLVLAENIATLLYINDRIVAEGAGEALAPAHGSREWYAFLHNLSFVATELHKAIGYLFFPTLTDEARAAHKSTLVTKRLKDFEELLGGKKFLNGDKLTVADIYAYVVLSWTGYVGVDLTPFPVAQAFFTRVKELPKVQAAHAAMAK